MAIVTFPGYTKCQQWFPCIQRDCTLTFHSFFHADIVHNCNFFNSSCNDVITGSFIALILDETWIHWKHNLKHVDIDPENIGTPHHTTFEKMLEAQQWVDFYFESNFLEYSTIFESLQYPSRSVLMYSLRWFPKDACTGENALPPWVPNLTCFIGFLLSKSTEGSFCCTSPNALSVIPENLHHSFETVLSGKS